MKKYCVFFKTLLLIVLLKADTNITNKEFPNRDLKLTYYGDGYLPSNTTQCSDLLDKFAESAADFTKCSIMNAAPVRLCEKCITNYMKFYADYGLLLTTVEEDGTSCKSMFISHDRLDAVLQFHDSILAIWNKGNCNGCYEWTNGTAHTSNKIQQFYQLLNETQDCINKYSNTFMNNNTEVCENCMQSYVQLNNYYESLTHDPVSLDTICMDIVDAMNATRSKWSKKLNCCKLRKNPETVFLCCTGIIALLPLLYYLAVRYCGPIRDLPNVLKQSRFKQTFLRTVNGRIN